MDVMKRIEYNIEPYIRQLEQWVRPQVGPIQTPLFEVKPDVLLTVQTEGGEIVYALELKTHLEHMNIHLVLDQMRKIEKETGLRCLVAAPYIRPQQGQELIQNGIDYVDLAGNVHLHGRRFLVHVEGKRPKAKPERIKGRAFRPAGLKAVYALLTNRELIHQPYREIAKATGVAHGTIEVVLRDLTQQGYKVGKGINTRIINRKELTNIWVTEYGNVMRPRLLIKCLRPQVRDLDKLVNEIRLFFEQRHIEWALTGTEAAYRLTRYYRDGTLTFFTKWLPEEFEIMLRCLPDTHGPLTVLELFNDYVIRETKDGTPIAHPLLIYAELMAAGTERNIETARLVYERYLKDFDIED